MPRAIIATILSAALLGCEAASTAAPADQAGAGATPSAATFDSSKAWEHLRQMVLLGPRPAGSEALRQTRAYITRQLAAAGLTIEEQPFVAQTPNGPINMVNLIARLPGKRTDRILLTGHYDTKLFKEFAFVGASDGASSAAMLIELARVLKNRPREYTYEFVWFDGEEAVCLGWDDCGRPGAPDNTYGSRYYVDAARKANALTSVKAMILLDMVGAKDLKLLKDVGMSANWLIDLFWSTARKMGHAATFVDQNYPIGGDDHEPFFNAGIPSLDLIDLDHYAAQWHTKDDDLAHVSARSLQIVGDVVLAALPDVEKRLAAQK